MPDYHDERPRVGADDDQYFEEAGLDHRRDWEERYDLSRPLYIRLRPPQYWELQRQARLQNLRAWELALSWVEERLADPVGREWHRYDPTPAYSPSLLKRLDVLEARIAALSAEIAWSAHVARNTTASPRPVEPAAEAPRTSRRTRVKPAASGAPLPLHETILELLLETGPMTVADIVDELNRRGEAARRGGPLTQSIVSGRIAHRRYRHLFERDGRLIAPARAGSGAR